MLNKNKLFGFKLSQESDFIEIGGGEGELSLCLKKKGFNLTLFIEPDLKKFKNAVDKLQGIKCLNLDIKELTCDQIIAKSEMVTVIMQDVIEHISIDKQKLFFEILSKKYKVIYLIGRTPNLKSPFGLRNSFGDNTHLHRFTNTSLIDFLAKLDFNKTSVTREDFRITGIISLLRYPPYIFLIISLSVIYLFIFGRWEGLLTPNIAFKSEKISKK
tara:strand:- start:302 stop:946 length:645 start_codon:yes stop_codon:yes gene_type:complete